MIHPHTLTTPTPASILAASVTAILALTGIANAQEPGNFKSLNHAVNIGGKLFFTADGGGGLGSELWVLDNGAEAARFVKDILPGKGSSAIGSILKFDSQAVFVAEDGTHGTELWLSDGTAAGTKMIRDVTKGATGSRIDLDSGAIVVGKSIFFFVDSASGHSLWKSAGPQNGTQLVESFPPSTGVKKPAPYSHRMTILPSGVVVMQVRGADAELHPWRTDGTATGTEQLASVALRADTGSFGRLGDLVYFAGRTGAEWDLWLTDGTVAGTRKVHGGLPGPPPTSKEKRLATIQFKTYCVTCHGTKGKGDGPAGMALNPKPRNWTDPKWQGSVTDERLLRVIRDGGAAVGLSPLMAPNPMYAKNPGVMKAMVELVRSFKGQK